MTSIPVSPTHFPQVTSLSHSGYIRPHVCSESQQVVFLNPPVSTLPPLLSPGSSSKHLKRASPTVSPSKVKYSKLPETLFQTRRPTPVHAIDYPKLISFLTNKHSADLYERHVHILMKLSTIYKDNAVPVEHVDPLGTVFVLVLNKVHQGAIELLQPLHTLVVICLEQAASMCWSIRFLEDLFVLLLSPKISSGCKDAIFNALHLLALHPHATILSHAFPTLFDLLSVSPNPIPLLQLFLLSTMQPSLTSSLLLLPFSSFLRSLLVSPTVPVYAKVLAMELSWAVIPLDQEDVDAWVPVLQAQTDLHLLLELLQFMCVMAEKATTVSWSFVGLLKDWTMGYELHRHPTCGPGHVFAGNLQAKQFMLACLEVYVHRSSDACLFVLDQAYFDFGMGYFTFHPPNTGYDQGWSIAALQQLQHLLLHQWTTVFLEVVHGHPDVLASMTVEVLDGLSQDDTWVHFFNELLQHGSSPPVLSNHVIPPLDTMEAFLRTVLAFAHVGPAQIPFQLGKRLLDPLLSLVHQRPAWLTLDAEIQLYLVLSALGAYHPTLFYHRQVLPVLIDQLGFCHPNPQCQAWMRMAVTMILWRVVHGQVVCEEQFLSLGGVFRLLSVLHQEQDTHVVGVMLSLLSDLLEAPKTRQHVVHWKSKDSHIWNVLLTLWKQQKAVLTFDKSVNAIEELNANFCCKLFGIFKKIGFDVSSVALTLEDRCLLLEIERYMDIKIGIVWEEIQYELIREGVRPTLQDEEVFHVAHQTLLEKQQLVQRLQTELRMKETQVSKEKEHIFYETYLKEEQKEMPISLQLPLSAYLCIKPNETANNNVLRVGQRKLSKHVRIQDHSSFLAKKEKSDLMEERIHRWKLGSLPFHSSVSFSAYSPSYAIPPPTITISSTSSSLTNNLQRRNTRMKSSAI